MIRSIFLIAASLTVFDCFCQNSIGLNGEPAYQVHNTNAIFTSFNDSIINSAGNDINANFNIEHKWKIDRMNSYSALIGYSTNSFKLTRTGLKLFDLIHPALPEIRDQGEASTKTAYLHYRFKYINAQALYYRNLLERYRSKTLGANAFVGVSYSMLVDNDLKVKSEGFSINQKFVNVVSDSIYYEGRKHLVNFHIGAEFSYEFEKDLQFVGGIKAGVPLMSNTVNQPMFQIFTPGIKFGLRYYY